MKQMLIVVLLMLGTFSIFAKNIQPVENIGRIKVELPDISAFPKLVQDEYKAKFEKVLFRDQEIQPGVEYFVEAGKGCSSLNFSKGYVLTEKVCGTIVSGQLTKLSFSAFHLAWSGANLKVDIGPSAKIVLSSEQGTILSSEYLDPYAYEAAEYANKNLFIVKPGNYKTTFYVNETESIIDEKIFTHSVSQKIDITPKDIRENLTTEVFNGPAKFAIQEKGAYVVFRSRPFSEAGKTLLPEHETKGYKIGNILNYKKIDATLQTQKFRFFPVDKANSILKFWVLEVVANETRWPLSFEKGLKQTVPIEIINVNSYQGEKKGGHFSLSRKDNEKWVPILRTYGNEADLKVSSFSLSSSHLLLPGYEYQFEFYILDDLKKSIKQNTVILDLK